MASATKSSGQIGWSRTSRNVASAVALCSLSVPVGVFAQSATPQVATIEEIIVTASKRAERLTDVPVAVTALSGETLAASGAVDFSSYSNKVPGLAFTRRGPSQNRLAIRGLTSFAGTDTEFPMVGLYLDDAPISDNNAPDIGLLDLERIEVLRGPQGTLYGEGSMGGTVKLVTRKPDPAKREGYLEAGAATTKSGGFSYAASAVMNMPIVSERVAVRVAAFHTEDGGFVDNLALGEEDADAYDRYGGRIALKALLSERLSLDGMVSYQKFNGGIEPVVFPKSLAGLTPPLLDRFGDTIGYRQVDERTIDELVIANLTLMYDADWATFTNATSYYERAFDALNDEINTSRAIEQSAAPLASALGIDPFFFRSGSVVSFLSDRTTFSNEFRATSQETTGWSWTGGAYYRHREIENDNAANAPDLVPIVGVFNPTYTGQLLETGEISEYEQFAVFGEVTLDLTPTLALTGGVRWFREQVSGQQFIAAADFSTGPDGFPGPLFGSAQRVTLPSLERTESKVLGKGTLSFKPTDDFLGYVSIAQGFRPGGLNARFNPFAAAGLSPRNFDSDSVLAYELGIKATLLGGALQTNIAGYMTQLEDAQFLDVRDPQFVIIRNAGDAEVYGVEAEISAALMDGFEVGTSLSWLNGEFSESALPIPDLPGVFLINEGQKLPVTREFSLGVFGSYSFALTSSIGAILYADLSHVNDTVANTSRLDTAPTLFGVLDGYTIANIRLTAEFEFIDVTVYVDNVTDEFAAYGGFTVNGLSRNKPRTIGLTSRLRF